MKRGWATWVFLAGMVYLAVTVCYEYFRHGRFGWLRAVALGFMAVGFIMSRRKSPSA